MGFVLSIFAPTPVTPGTAAPVPPPQPTNANGEPYHTTDANGNPIPLEGIADVERKFLGGFPDDDPFDDVPFDGALRKLRF